MRPTLATQCWEGVSVYRTFVFLVFTLHQERDMQRLRTENPWASKSTSPRNAQHYDNWSEDRKELSSPRPSGSFKCSSANISFDYALNAVWRQPISNRGSEVDFNSVLLNWQFSEQRNKDEQLPPQRRGKAWKAHKMLWSLYLLSGCSKKHYLEELDAGTRWAKTLLFLWKEAEQRNKPLWKKKKRDMTKRIWEVKRKCPVNMAM